MSWNVFADLDLPKPDEEFLKVGLLRAIADIMRKSGLTQSELAGKAGLKQPEVSRIMSGRWSGFSTDRLARTAFRLGYLPMIDLKPMSAFQQNKAKKKASRKAA